MANCHNSWSALAVAGVFWLRNCETNLHVTIVKIAVVMGSGLTSSLLVWSHDQARFRLQRYEEIVKDKDGT